MSKTPQKTWLSKEKPITPPRYSIGTEDYFLLVKLKCCNIVVFTPMYLLHAKVDTLTENPNATFQEIVFILCPSSIWRTRGGGKPYIRLQTQSNVFEY